MSEVLGETEINYLGYGKTFSFVEDALIIYVEDLTSLTQHHDVITMPITHSYKELEGSPRNHWFHEGFLRFEPF